ncbi:MAG: hypothetical protein ACR2MX_07250 [Cyclobacteriaceae bacterium]
MNKRKGIGIFAFGILAVFGLSAVVMLLWNYAVVSVFNANPVTYWQAMALLVLSKILLGGFHMGRRGGWAGHKKKWRGKFGHMSDEERSRFKEKWKRRCEERKNSKKD